MDHWSPQYRCLRCPRPFASEPAMEQHQRMVDHWEYDCETCTRTFPTQSQCNAHMSNAGHYEFFCKDCDRNFQNANNLRMVRSDFVADISSLF